MINPNIFRAYDIRGKYGKDLDKSVATIIGKGFGTYLGGNKSVVVGRDNRVHGQELQRAFIDGLMSTGCKVTNIGLSPSPYLYFSDIYGNFDAGCNVTASHNPPADNGFKLISKNAHSICGEEIKDIYNICYKGKFISGKGDYFERTFIDKYYEKLRQMFHFDRGIKIVVDCGNGVTGYMYPRLLRELGIDVIELYTELDGNFPNHQPDPIVETNLKDLKEKVIENHADFGVAFDGDGDRVAFIDAKGEFYNSDKTLNLLSIDLLNRKRGSKIVMTVSNSEAMYSDIENRGGIPIMTKVGHSFVEQTMTVEDALLGGEQSGHFFVKEDYYPFDDALVTTLKITEIFNDNKNLSFEGLFYNVPKTFSVPELRPYVADTKKFQLIDSISRYFTQKYNCNTMDGVRIRFGNNAWAGIRASNTSPRISICIEATDKNQLDQIKDEVINHLESYPSIDWDK